MSQELYTQVDFAERLSRELGKSVSKQNVNYYKQQGMLVLVSGLTIKDPGNTSFLKGESVSKKDFESENLRVERDGGQPASGRSKMLVDYEKSYKLLNKKIDPSHNQKFASASANDSCLSQTESSQSSEAGAFNYNDSKARNEHYKAEISRMDAEEKAGKLTSTQEVEDDGYTTAARTRDSLLDIPYHLSATLAAMTDPDKIEELLTTEIEKALRSLSKKFKEEVEEECA